MKLLHSPLSPYSAKVRMAAIHAGVALDHEAVDTSANPAVLLAANPLGKIPTLVLDDGGSVFDSRAVVQHLNRVSGGKLFPRSPGRRMEAERLEALADGVCDSLLAMIYERRYRPEEKVHEPWLERQWDKVERGLDWLIAHLPRLTGRIHAGHIAVRAMIGYLGVRFAGRWEKGRRKLLQWVKKFDAKFPDIAAAAPDAKT